MRRVGIAHFGAASAWPLARSAASAVNLMPPGVYYSYATAVHGNVQVGTALPRRQACGLWQGTRESYVDLHQFLPPGYERSHALGVWTDGATIRVVGYGVPGRYAREPEALLWTYTPCPADLDNDGDFGNGLTRDGAVTIEDLLSFLVGFEAGQCPRRPRQWHQHRHPRTTPSTSTTSSSSSPASKRC